MGGGGFWRLERERERGGGGENRDNVSPPQHPRGPSKAKHEPKLVHLYGAGGEGAGTPQLSQRQRLPHSPHLQEELHSEDCCACNEEELPPKYSSSPPPPPPPPPPPWLSSAPSPPPPSPPLSPPLFLPLLPPHLQARSLARPVPESVANLFYITREEKRRDDITWPAGAGGKVGVDCERDGNRVWKLERD